MSSLRVSVCCGAQVRPYDGGDPICCECGRENVMVETVAQRDHRMRVEGAKVFASRVADATQNRVSGGWPDDCGDEPEGWELFLVMLHGDECGDFVDDADAPAHFLKLFDPERIVGEWEASNGSA